MKLKPKLHRLYVYGTLRPGSGHTVEIPGFLHDLGWFPGVKLGGPGCNSHFVAEVIEVDDDRLRELDGYEGFDPSNTKGSLYIRKPFRGGWIYTYNRPMDTFPHIPGGDWLKYRDQTEGVAADMVAPRKPDPEPVPEEEPETCADCGGHAPCNGFSDGERAAK